MKPGSKLFFLSLALASFSGCQKPTERQSFTVEHALDSLFHSVPDFSGVALVAHDGKAIYHKGVGYLDFEAKTPIDTNAIFELASVSKQFTAAVVLMLQEQGKLSVEDPIEKFIPGLPYPGITVRHLLTHTSGLPDYQAIMDQYWDKTKVAANEDNIEYLKKYSPEKRFVPGEKYEYSNTGYMLLATVAEKASGQDFIAFCREQIFTPLQMNSTDIRTRDEKISLPKMAWGHLWVEEKQRFVRADSFPAFNYTIWLGNRKGPGRISSTAKDLLRWDKALREHSLLKEETLAAAFSSTRLNDGTLSPYGFGWQIEQDTLMGKVVRHSGDNPGYKTHIIRYVDKNKTVILLCNNAHKKFDEILRAIEVAVREG